MEIWRVRLSQLPTWLKLKLKHELGKIAVTNKSTTVAAKKRFFLDVKFWGLKMLVQYIFKAVQYENSKDRH